MNDIRQLRTMLLELDDLLVTCMRCGMCQAVCPVFSETLMEGDVTRGKIALLNGLSHQMIRDADGVKRKLDKCLLCGSCEANCPSGVKVTDIFLKARAILTTYQGLSPIKRMVFRGGLSNPRLFTALLGLGEKMQRVFLTDASLFHGTSCAAIKLPFMSDRHLVPLADRFFFQRVSSVEESGVPGRLKVAVFPGCVVDKIYPNIGTALLKILRFHGLGIYMPENQACCGLPALASGDRRTFDRLLKHNLALFEKVRFDVLVTPCATCTSTLKKLWPTLTDGLSEKAAEDIGKIAEKVMDISEFLIDVLNVTETGGNPLYPQTVTWHDPCHLKKSVGVFEQPRQLLKSIPGISLTEMRSPDTCCGSGGSFNLQHYEISKKIGMQKADQIVDTGAEIVATGCPACMMQMMDMLSQKDASVSVRHVVELYADSLQTLSNQRQSAGEAGCSS